METPSHQAEIIRQFTLQARPFAEHKSHSLEVSLVSICELAHLDGTQRVLDAGCGPGLVSCFAARHARSVTGLDLTEAMITEARATAGRESVANVQFVAGNIAAMPFPDAVFDVAVSRYVFHHLNEPAAAFAEMVRVIRPGGRIVVADATPPADKRSAYDAFEKRRDPSHTSARTIEELLSFGESHGLGDATVRRFGVPMEIESLIDSSFPEPGTREALVKAICDDVTDDLLGFSAQERAGKFFITFPVTVAGWTKLTQRRESCP